jgi:hypothetical protein
MSPDTTDDPYALLEHFSLMADPRRVAHLTMFLRLCQEHHARGNLDFRTVTMAALSEAESGYSYASLRNRTGKPYRQLIAAYARSVGGWTHRPTRDSLPPWSAKRHGPTTPHVPSPDKAKPAAHAAQEAVRKPLLPTLDRSREPADWPPELWEPKTRPIVTPSSLPPALARAVANFVRTIEGGELAPLGTLDETGAAIFCEH